MSEAMRTMARRWFEEGWNARDDAVVDEYSHPNAVYHALFGPDPADHSPGGFKRLRAALLQAFPDLHFTLEDVLVEGDRLAVRYSAVGTHIGACNGVAPTGEQVRLGGVAIARMQGGQVVESWDAVMMDPHVQRVAATISQ